MENKEYKINNEDVIKSLLAKISKITLEHSQTEAFVNTLFEEISELKSTIEDLKSSETE